jgi:hypothetical protein
MGHWLLMLILLVTGPVWAAEAPDAQARDDPPVYPWNQFYLRWQPNGPPDPSVTTYVLECGRKRGAYTVISEYHPSVVVVLMKEILPEGGKWACRVSAMAGSTVRARSPEYVFDLRADLSIEGFVESPCP